MNMRQWLVAMWIAGCVAPAAAWAQRTYLESGMTSTNVPGGLLGEIGLHTGIGRVSYEENVSFDAVDSDFSAILWTLGADWTYVDRSGYKLRLRGSFWRSGSDTEEWTSRGQLVQENDLEISGGEIAGQWGWQFTRRPDHSLTGWLGVGYTRQQFERSSFQSFGREPSRVSGSVDEDFDVAFVDAALEGHVLVRPRWRLTYLAGAGYVFSNEADNNALGSIDGDGGVLVHAGLGAAYLLSDAHRVSGGVRYEYQELDGDQTTRTLVGPDGQRVASILEWPDNELTRLWFDVRWTAAF